MTKLTKLYTLNICWLLYACYTSLCFVCFFLKASALPTWKCWTQKRSPYICSYIMFLTFHQGLVHIPKISWIGTGSRGERQSRIPLPQSSLQPTTVFPNLYLFFWHLNSHVLPVSIILLFPISISPPPPALTLTSQDISTDTAISFPTLMPSPAPFQVLLTLILQPQGGVYWQANSLERDSHGLS